MLTLCRAFLIMSLHIRYQFFCFLFALHHLAFTSAEIIFYKILTNFYKIQPYLKNIFIMNFDDDDDDDELLLWYG